MFIVVWLAVCWFVFLLPSPRGRSVWPEDDPCPDGLKLRPEPAPDRARGDDPHRSATG